MTGATFFGSLHGSFHIFLEGPLEGEVYCLQANISAQPLKLNIQQVVTLVTSFENTGAGEV